MDQTIEETINKIQTQLMAQKDLAPKQALVQSIISLQMTVPTMRDSSDQCIKGKL